MSDQRPTLEYATLTNRRWPWFPDLLFRLAIMLLATALFGPLWPWWADLLFALAIMLLATALLWAAIF
jgi:hypothetical protein